MMPPASSTILVVEGPMRVCPPAYRFAASIDEKVLPFGLRPKRAGGVRHWGATSFSRLYLCVLSRVRNRALAFAGQIGLCALAGCVIPISSSKNNAGSSGTEGTTTLEGGTPEAAGGGVKADAGACAPIT